MADEIRPPEVWAILGPTNTGKTHRAIETMLAHKSGMIGLPLRMLAREIYDRVAKRAGVNAVALVTGEEKILPAHPSYFICTIEAMPLNRPVEVLIVDEIQMASDPVRGHIFTDRILHARGSKTTMFLGAATMAPILRRLVPDTVIDQSGKRRSELFHDGIVDIAGLPPGQIAIVAFSNEQVHKLAESVRTLYGACAVVSGALSPAARNKQIELFNSRQVRVLVTTDAIGMGLNTTADRVYFAATRKFDGQKERSLYPEEVAQIAGRAGRDQTDGSFGMLRVDRQPDTFDPKLVDAVLAHKFEPVRKVMWRNAALDFSSPEALLQSLYASSPAPDYLTLVDEAEDHRTLRELIKKGISARTKEEVSLLWDVAQIPDFRKRMSTEHVTLLADIYGRLRTGALTREWLNNNISSLDNSEASLESLIAAYDMNRTLRYIAHKAGWVDDPVAWQTRTADVEIGLSNAMDQFLRERFAGKVTAKIARQLRDQEEITITESDCVLSGGNLVGQLKGFGFCPNTDSAQIKSIYRRLRDHMPGRVAALLESGDTDFAFSGTGEILWRGQKVGFLAAQDNSLNRNSLHPRIIMCGCGDLLNDTQKIQIRDHLKSWLDREICCHLRALVDLAAAHNDLQNDFEYKGLAYGTLGSLVRGLGVVALEGTTLGQRHRELLERQNVCVGKRFLYVKGIFEPDAIHLRAALWNAEHGTSYNPPAPGAPSVSVDPNAVDRDFYRSIGFPVLRTRAVRADLLETHLYRAAGGMRLDVAAAGELGIPYSDLPGVNAALNPRPVVTTSQLAEGLAPLLQRATLAQLSGIHA